MSLIYAYQNRTITKDIVMKNGAGTVVVPGANDKIRVVIGREGCNSSDLSTAKLVVSSEVAETANGSSFTKNSPSSGTNRLRLDNQDLTFEAGTYTLFVDFFDNADGSDWKNVDRQVFVLERT